MHDDGVAASGVDKNAADHYSRKKTRSLCFHRFEQDQDRRIDVERMRTVKPVPGPTMFALGVFDEDLANGVRGVSYIMDYRNQNDTGRMKLQIHMLSGDNHETAQSVQSNTPVFSQVRIIQELKENLGVAGMIGDGINDALALAAADVGFAMGLAGSAVAVETSDVFLMTDDLRKLSMVVSLGRRVHTKVIQNVVISVGLKVAILAFSFAGYGYLWMAVLVDVGACLLVISNSTLLLRGTGKKRSSGHHHHQGKNCKDHDHDHDGGKQCSKDDDHARRTQCSDHEHGAEKHQHHRHPSHDHGHNHSHDHHHHQDRGVNSAIVGLGWSRGRWRGRRRSRGGFLIVLSDLGTRILILEAMEGDDTTCRSLLRELQSIWEETGESDEERDRMLLQLEQECLDVYRRKLEKRSGTTLREQLLSVSPQLECLRLRKEERLKQFEDVQCQIQRLSQEISPGALQEAENGAFSWKGLLLRKLYEYHCQVQELQDVKSTRLHKFSELLEVLQGYCVLLGADYTEAVKEVHPSLCDPGQSRSISDETLENLVKTIGSQDESRFNATRGAHLNLKRAERARDIVAKLPNLLELLKSKMRSWEDERGRPFLYNGISLLAILEEYSLLRREKEEEKRRLREEKRMQEQLQTEQELLYGTKPSKKGQVGLRVSGNNANRRLSIVPELLPAPKASNQKVNRVKRYSPMMNYVALPKDPEGSSIGSAPDSPVAA
ncbi:hypothetical protein SELMODRAFT_422818 [Selaginella moellendorffii]|uniref:HMA domain-containing protein n=1 Tax=Selaginella moellendorffii TaxID=88036 RepID=D8SJN0_SELML|nr:hypothetical protein SELMODRAFT_422818 [Selaginella moellendorffii]